MAAKDDEPKGKPERSRRGTRTQRFTRATWRWTARVVMVSAIIDPWLVPWLSRR